jgi:hypothetical protein
MQLSLIPLAACPAENDAVAAYWPLQHRPVPAQSRDGSNEATHRTNILDKPSGFVDSIQRGAEPHHAAGFLRNFKGIQRRPRCRWPPPSKRPLYASQAEKHTALLLGRTCNRNHCRLPRDEMCCGDLHCLNFAMHCF